MSTTETTQHDLPVQGGRRYTNPVRYLDGMERTNPDPFVLRFRGKYFCYASGESGVHVSRSANLAQWENLGHALEVDGRRQYWAPCVIYADGLFWMYFSNRPNDSDDPHDEHLQLATSAQPQGPFVVRRRLFDTFSIDPHVVRDEDGQYYLFYSTNDVTGLRPDNAGTSIVVDRMPSMDALAGDPRPVVVPTLQEEIFQSNRFGDGRDWHTIEGAAYATHHGTAFVTYSGNAYVGEDYFIGYSRAALDGPISSLSWSKYPSDFIYAPLVRRNAEVSGAGHNSIVAAPNLVDDWIVYHGRDAAATLTPDKEQRVMRIDPLFYDGDTLSTNAPSSAAQDAPALPTVFDDFSMPDLRPSWRVLGGSFTTGDEALTSRPEGISVVVHALETTAYVAEVYLRATPTSTGARLGILPIFHDANNHLEILLDAGTRTICAQQVVAGIATTLATQPLAGLTFAAWHAVRVHRTFDLVEVWVDGAKALVVSADDGPARVGLIAVHTAASFSAFTLTEHLDLHGDTMSRLPRLLTADSRVELTGAGLGTPLRRPVHLTSGTVRPGTVTTHEFELAAPYSCVDLYPVYVDPANHVRVHLDPDSVDVEVVRAGTRERIGHRADGRSLRSVRTAVRDDTVVVRAGGRSYHIDNPAAGPFTQRIDLVGSMLRSLEQTALVQEAFDDKSTQED